MEENVLDTDLQWLGSVHKGPHDGAGKVIKCKYKYKAQSYRILEDQIL